MKFLVYAQVDQGNIGKKLGTADYSYFFLLRTFSEVLQELGDVVQLRDPQEATAIHAQCAAVGEQCVLFSFTPPHKTPLELGCPTIPVFAWEYPNIPEDIREESWRDDPRHDWRYVFHRTGSAIALSTHTVDAVKKSMGPHFPIAAIPAPLTRRAMLTGRRPVGIGHQVPLTLVASVADSRSMGLDSDSLVAATDDDGTHFHPDDAERLPLLLPVRAVAVSDGDVQVGDSGEEVLLAEGEQWPLPCSWDPPPPARVRLDPQGVVYTSVLTPEAGRKNWGDLLTAFCWAFRDNADAILILKIAGTDLLRCHRELLMWLTKLSPFKCRVLSVSGFLPDEDYAALQDATTFYVNTSLCEGLCLPLVEFLGSGIPAIAPDHTAMADYINSDIAFVVRSFPGEPTVWPHGDMQMDSTSFQQLDWQSLHDAFRRSYEMATLAPERYAAMSLRAHETIQDYCGPGAVKRQLQRFLELPSEAHGNDARQVASCESGAVEP